MIRGAAVQPVQRLAQSGLEEAYATHAARRRLADMLLTDRRLIVRVLAARVLCLRGGNPPLEKIWIGER